MNVFVNKYECCGCTSCMNICPQQAIKMTEDEEGFLYPKIDTDKCIECNLCIETCVFKDKEKIIEGNKPITYGVIHKNNDIRKQSRSGGVFTALSDYILSKNGVIYGVGYEEHFKVSHKRAINEQERNEFRGSKYVQSDLNGIFKFVKADLENGKDVLFTGTPCQVDGLYSYLSHFKNLNIDKLITCDLICHGTPSPLIWKEYLNFQEKRYKGVIQSFNFRNKALYGWEEHVESFFVNGKEHSSRIFTKLFYEHIILRPSCHKCPYTSIYRNADITLGDFWGIEKNINEFNDNKGVSLILINTDKGKMIFDIVKNQFKYNLCNIENSMQPGLYKNFKENKKRSEFWKDYCSYGFDYVLNKYLGYGRLFNIKEYIRLVIKKNRFRQK